MALNSDLLRQFAETFKTNNSKKDLEQINTRKQVLQSNINTVNQLLEKFQGITEDDKQLYKETFNSATPSYNLRTPVVHVWLNKVKIFPEISVPSQVSDVKIINYVASLKSLLDVHFESFQLDMPFGGVSQTITGDLVLFSRTPVELIEFAIDSFSTSEAEENPSLPVMDLQFGWTVTDAQGQPKQLLSSILSFLVMDIQTPDFGNSQGSSIRFRLQDAGSAVLQNSSSDLAVMADFPQEQLRTLLEGFLGIRLFTLDDLLYFNEIQEGVFENIYKKDAETAQRRNALMKRVLSSKEDVVALAATYGIRITTADIDTQDKDTLTAKNSKTYQTIRDAISKYIIDRRKDGELQNQLKAILKKDLDVVIAKQQQLYPTIERIFNDPTAKWRTPNTEGRVNSEKFRYPEKSYIEIFTALQFESVPETKLWNELEKEKIRLKEAAQLKSQEYLDQANLAQKRDLPNLELYFNKGTERSLGNLEYEVRNFNSQESDNLSKTFFVTNQGAPLRINSNTIETVISTLLQHIKCRWYPSYNVNLKDEVAESQAAQDGLEQFRSDFKLASTEEERTQLREKFSKESIKIAQNCKLVYVPGIDPTIRTSGSDIYFKTFSPEAGAYFLLPEEFLDITLEESELPLIYGAGGSNVPYLYAGGQNVAQALRSNTEFYGEVISLSAAYNALIATMRACVNEDMGTVISGARLAARNSAALQSKADREASVKSLQSMWSDERAQKEKEKYSERIEEFRTGERFRAIRHRFQKTIGAKRLIYGDDPTAQLDGVSRSYRNSYTPMEEARQHLRKRVSMFLNYPQTISMTVFGDPFLLRQGVGAFELLNYYLDITTNNLRFNYMLSGTYIPQKITHSLSKGDYTTSITALKVSPSSKGVLKELAADVAAPDSVASQVTSTGVVTIESSSLQDAELYDTLVADVSKLQTAKATGDTAQYNKLLAKYRLSQLQTIVEKLQTSSGSGN